MIRNRRVILWSAATVGILALGLSLVTSRPWLRERLSALAATVGVDLGLGPTPKAEARPPEVLLDEMRECREGELLEGWTGRIWRLAWLAGRRADLPRSLPEEMRAEVTASLGGVDVSLIRTVAGVGAYFLRSDRAGARLLLGGAWREAAPAGSYTAGILHFATHPLAPFKAGGMGPVTFREDGMPVQLLPVEGVEGRPDELTLVDLAGGRVLTRFTLGGRLAIEYVNELGLAEDASLVAAPIRDGVGEAGTVRLMIWDGATGRELLRLPFASRSVAFSPDRRLIAAGDDRGEVSAWSLKTGRVVASFREESPVRCLAFAADGLTRLGAEAWEESWPGAPVRRAWRLAVGGLGGTISIREVADEPAARRGAEASSRSDTPSGVCHVGRHELAAVGFSPDGSILASCGEDRAMFWDPVTGAPLVRLDFGRHLRCFAFSPQGRSLAISDAEHDRPGITRVWRVSNGRGIHRLRGQAGRPGRPILSPDNTRIAAATIDGRVGIWDQRPGTLRLSVPIPRDLGPDRLAMQFSPDGRHLAIAGGGRATLWDLRAGARLSRWSFPPATAEGVDALAFPEADRLLSIRLEPSTDAGQPRRPWRMRIRNLLGRDPLRPTVDVTLAAAADIPVTSVPRRVAATPDGKVGLVELERPGKPGTAALRMIRAFATSTGKPLWSEDLGPVPEYGPGWDIDPAGRIVVLNQPTPAGGGWARIEVETGKRLEPFPSTSGLLGIGPGAETWVSAGKPDLPLGIAFHRHADGPDQPFLSAPGNAFPTPCTPATFARDGLVAAWGNPDGTISAWNLDEVNRAFVEFGLAR